LGKEEEKKAIVNADNKSTKALTSSDSSTINSERTSIMSKREEMHQK